MNNKYFTPRLDNVLKRHGWIRANEAPVYYRSNPDSKYKWKITRAMDIWYMQEKYFEDDLIKNNISNFENSLNEQFEKCFDNTFCTTDKIRDKRILEETANFFFWENEPKLSKKYEELYNNFGK
jgi:hypothetical protein